MRLTRPGVLAAGLAIAAAGLTTAAPAAAATTGTLSCTVANPLQHYKNNWRNVSGSVDNTAALLSATVTRTVSGEVDITSTSPILDNGFEGGYYLQHYGWNTWVVGTVQTVYGGQTYWVLLPDTAQPNNTPFTGEVMTGLGYPGYQQRLTCTVN